jgi:hypothetical protein
VDVVLPMPILDHRPRPPDDDGDAETVCSW